MHILEHDDVIGVILLTVQSFGISKIFIQFVNGSGLSQLLRREHTSVLNKTD